ncbi:MAG: hypothetical protein JOZ69_14425 [Myxococcales bacterium]|nr:hypothetical protein [Myxococcales bacterium]
MFSAFAALRSPSEAAGGHAACLEEQRIGGRLMRPTLLVLTFVALGLVACENRYVYVPARTAGGDVAGRPASDVAIPPEAPRGNVQVATFGISEVEPTGEAAEGGTVRALHLRMLVTNNSDQPWMVDTRQQRIELDGRSSRPAYASADGGSSPPTVTVPSGSKRTIDLFFPLPLDMARASRLPAFDAIWTVQTDTRPITERIPFERMQVEPQSAYAYNWDYWGSPFWYDPLYPSGPWLGVSLGPRFVRRPVMIHRPPPLVAPPARRVR